MNTNQQFAVSCHILTLLAARPDSPLTSEVIAQSVDTNPVVIRRIMSHLRKHGLVVSRPGASGGWRLVRDPSELTLREVFRATSHEDMLLMHKHPNPDCPVGGNIQYALSSVFIEARTAMELALDKFSVTNILESVIYKSHQQET